MPAPQGLSLAALKVFLEAAMSTRNVIETYFNQLKTGKGWESQLADDVTFTSFTSPIKQIAGKQAYIEATKRFYSTIQSFELRTLIVDGAHACALTRYQLKAPAGVFQSDVAEIYTVRDAKIASFGIYFDTAPFPK
jgi:ketosteroid isomerase-like protein